MSFVRAGRSQLPKAKGPGRGKRGKLPKREWVSTVNDLSVHKLTPAEQLHRHEIHKSHNKAAAHWELKEKALRRRVKHVEVPSPLDPTSLSIIKEVLSDQTLLQDVLARSDRAMAVVKDLFGDAPPRQMGHPSVTIAPNCDPGSELPVLERPDPPTHLSLLSQSMMDQQALNDIKMSKGNHIVRDVYPPNGHMVRKTNVRKMKLRTQNGEMQKQMGLFPNFHYADRADFQDTPYKPGKFPNPTALNATTILPDVRAKQTQSSDDEDDTTSQISQVLNPKFPFSQSALGDSCPGKAGKNVSYSSSVVSLSGDQSSLGMLQSMLGQVQADLDILYPEIPTAESSKQNGKQSLTGFSVALVSTLGRLVYIFKQTDEEARRGTEKAKQLEKELKEQRGLVDALTAEILTLKEETTSLHEGLAARTAELEQKFDALLLVMNSLGLLDERSALSRTRETKSADPRLAVKEVQTRVPPAVLLSPPQQGDNRQLGAQPPKHFPRYPHSMRPPGSGLNEGRMVASPSPTCPQLSPEVLMDEVLLLRRENELIRAQLNQAKALGSGAPRLPNRSEQEGRAIHISSGRISPPCVREGRPSGGCSSNERGPEGLRRDKELSPTNSVKFGSEVNGEESCSSSLSVSSVEQRLLELNRQSAAARGRLLQLIEQQKQSTSARSSPPRTPTPPPVVSLTAGGGNSTVSELPPEHQLPPLSEGGGGGRPRFELGDEKLQPNRPRKQDGWFALSANVR